MRKVRVENMTSDRSGREVANQFIIRTEDGVYFQSYNATIAFIPNKFGAKTQLDERFWDYSRTTGKYRNNFLGEGIAETRKKLESGEYELVTLNG